MTQVVAALRLHDGNVAAAAVAVAAARQSIIAFLARHRDELPRDVLDLVEARRRPRRAGIAA